MLQRILVHGIFGSALLVFCFFILINIATWIAGFFVDASSLSYSGWINNMSVILFAFFILFHNLFTVTVNKKAFGIAMNIITCSTFIIFYLTRMENNMVFIIMTIPVFFLCMVLNWYLNKIIDTGVNPGNK